MDNFNYIQDYSGIHVILDRSLAIQDSNALSAFDKFNPSDSDGIVVYVQVDKSNVVQIVAASFKSGWTLQDAKNTVLLKRSGWLHQASAMFLNKDEHTTTDTATSAGPQNTESEQQPKAQDDTGKQDTGNNNTGKKGPRPTLFNLLEVLASDSITTPEQRRCIRGIVTDFLTNEIPHGKVYAYIGAIIGHDALHNVIRLLENDTKRSSVLEPQGLMRIEAAFGLSGSAASAPPNTPPTPAPSGPLDKAESGVKSSGAPVEPENQQLGFGATSKEEILRAIRRNLDARRGQAPRPSGIPAAAGLLQKTCWLPVRRPLSAGPIYGHNMICVGGKAYFIGGSSERGKPPGFSSTHSVSLVDFTSRQIGLSGDIPSQREYNSCNFAMLHGVHSVVLFGGFDGMRFLNDLHVLDMETRSWSLRVTSGPLPAPRDQHTALIYPARSDLSDTRTRSVKNAEYLFVFGGRTGSRQFVQCLNDMWAFHFETSTWVQVMTDELAPAPRFGMDAVWTDDFNLCFFGGETILPPSGPASVAPDGANFTAPGASSGLPKRHLLDDLWIFKLVAIRMDESEHSIVGCWQREEYEGHIGPRSHCKAIFIAQRSKEARTGEPRTVERLMLLSGGLTYSRRPGQPHATLRGDAAAQLQGSAAGSGLSPLESAPKASAPGRVVASEKIFIYFFSQHRWYSIRPNYPREFRGTPFGPRQLHVMCFFEKRNLTSAEYRPPVPCIFIHGGYHKKSVLSDAWVLSLTGEDPFTSVSGIKFRAGNVVAPAHPSGTQVADKIPPGLRTYPPWYYRESHAPGLLWAFCGLQKWALGAFAHLLHNALAPRTASSNIHVRRQLGPEGELMICVQDDGQGLDFTAMNRLLRLYGQAACGEAACGQEQPLGDHYGCGFKLAFSRLATGCVVMSRTLNTIGIGMASQELMSHCESREMATPLCMWRLPNKEFISADGAADQRHHQRLLMSYSPFGTPTLLAEQINVLGTFPGTIFLFWNLRSDLDNVVFSEEDKCFLLPVSSSDGRPGAKAPPDAEGMQLDSPGAAPWVARFPLWSSSQYSIDYCLPTYLFWSHLRSPASIFCEGELLKCRLGPRARRVRAFCGDSSCAHCEVSPVCNSALPLGYTNSLYEFLRSSLYCCAELICLFSPHDHRHGASAIIGFLNPPPQIAPQDSPSSYRICEAGILLYYKNRLIRRYESPFPEAPELLDSAALPPLPSLFEGRVYKHAFTAAINVPDWLLPAVTKQEFVHEGNSPFFLFQRKLRALIEEYLTVCLNQDRLDAWVDSKNRMARADFAVPGGPNAAPASDADSPSNSEDELVPPIDASDVTHSPR